MLSREEVISARSLAERWSSLNGDAGYDPYDIYHGRPYLLGLMGDKKALSRPRLALRYIIHLANIRLPKMLRRLLGVRPLVHATYLANRMQALALDYQRTSDLACLEQAIGYRAQLLDRCIRDFGGMAWGTPFEWRSGEQLYHLGTPFAVVSAWVGDAFMTLYEVRSAQEDLDVCRGIADFFATGLGYTSFDDGSLCFGYSPLGKDLIHNANLFAGEYLIRVGALTGNGEWMDLGRRAVSFSAGDLMDDGHLPYYASASPKHSAYNDSYHSSYEIRMMYSAWRHIGGEELRAVIERYLGYYVRRYLNPDGSISLHAEGQYPIDSTALADAVIMLIDLAADFETGAQADKVVSYLIEQMQSDEGAFYYRRYTASRVARIPYIRWSQGWATLALSHYLAKR